MTTAALSPSSSSSSSSVTRESLLERATSLCNAFSSHQGPIDDALLLQHFTDDVECLEHGLPQLAPFLGRPFHGIEGARRYFQLIGDLLDFSDMSFSDYMVDVDALSVSVRGQAKFVWKATGNAWDEVFTYRLKFDPASRKIRSYHVWADSGAAYLARRRALTRNVVLVTYEFTYSPFSGNGILARSIAKSLLQLGCHVTVWCCKPSIDDDGNNINSTNNHHLVAPEITPEQQARLVVIPLQLQKHHGWRKLDDESAWECFDFENLDNLDQVSLGQAVTHAHVVCAVDWTGARANRSLLVAKKPPIVYMNFRVYSLGVNEEERRAWFNEMERQALEGSSAIVALSEQDRSTLEAIASYARDDIEILLPPLRGDIQQLATQSSEELAEHLPKDVAAALRGSESERIFVTCVVRLSKEKNVMRFVKFVEQANLHDGVGGCGAFVPLLAGASADDEYAARVKQELKRVAPNAIIIDSFLSPQSLAAVFSRTCLNFHPCAYDAYGMTIVEAAACGAPSVLLSFRNVGASALLLSRDSSFLPLEEQMPISSSCCGDDDDDDAISDDAVTMIVNLLHDQKKRDLMGRNAQTIALGWDEEAYGKKLLEIIARVLEDFDDKNGIVPR